MIPLEDAGRVAQHDEAVESVDITTIQVHRLNGELFEVPLTNVEANQLEFNRDQKRCLANKDLGD